jgi:hypothetical protein
MTDVPTYTECVIGYRRWTIDAFGQLRPVTLSRAPWQPGVNTAECRWREFQDHAHTFRLGALEPKRPDPGLHAAPGPSCECGIYAMHELSRLAVRNRYPADEYLANGVPVVGAVAAFGRLEVHESGFRAEKAAVVALATVEGMGPKARALVEHVAAQYGVPCVPIELLEAEALQHGSPLPTEARPEREPDRMELRMAMMAAGGLRPLGPPPPPRVPPRPSTLRLLAGAVAAAATAGVMGVFLSSVLDGMAYWLAAVPAAFLIGNLVGHRVLRPLREGTPAS